MWIFKNQIYLIIIDMFVYVWAHSAIMPVSQIVGPLYF